MGRSTDTSGVYDAFAVTPHDTNALAGGSVRGVYVGVSGDLKVTLASGSTVTFVGLAAGVEHPIQANIIWSTGTTATSILGLR